MQIQAANNKNEIIVFFNIIERCRSVMATHQSGQWQGQEPSLNTLMHDYTQGHLYFAYNQQEIIGGCALLPYDSDYGSLLTGSWFNEDPYIAIHRFAIDPRLHGQGYGKRLLLGLEKIVHLMARVNIRVDTHKANVAMHRLLIGSGYQICGTVLLKHAGERVVYQKVLRE